MANSTRTTSFLNLLIVKMDAMRSPEASKTAYRRQTAASQMVRIFISTAGIN